MHILCCRIVIMSDYRLLPSTLLEYYIIHSKAECYLYKIWKHLNSEMHLALGVLDKGLRTYNYFGFYFKLFSYYQGVACIIIIIWVIGTQYLIDYLLRQEKYRIPERDDMKSFLNQWYPMPFLIVHSVVVLGDSWDTKWMEFRRKKWS